MARSYDGSCLGSFFSIMIAPTYATEAQSLAGSVCAFTNSWVNAAGKGSDFDYIFI